MSGLCKISIPEDVQSIGQAAFAECACLKKVSLPAGLRTLGSVEDEHNWEGVFQETDISRITIPPLVTSLPPKCFKSCYTLKTVNLPSQLTTIGKQCFEGSKIASLTLPASLTEIGDEAFKNCKNLSTIKL